MYNNMLHNNCSNNDVFERNLQRFVGHPTDNNNILIVKIIQLLLCILLDCSIGRGIYLNSRSSTIKQNKNRCRVSICKKKKCSIYEYIM